MNTPNVRKARTKSPLINEPATYELEVVSINRTLAKVARTNQLTCKYRDIQTSQEFIDYIALNQFLRDEDDEFELDTNNERKLDVESSRKMVEDKVEDLIGSMIGINKGEEFALLFDDDDGLYPTQSITDKQRKSLGDEVVCLDDLVGLKFVATIALKGDRLRITKSYTTQDGVEIINA